jgi:L-threonylcarbamoyladenylate synthase
MPANMLLLQARDRLLAGDVVGIPTETVYGLAASIDSEPGLRKVFRLKNRPFFDPLIVHVASAQDALSLVQEWPPLVDFLTRTFWPGPLTIVLPKSARVHPLITSGLDTVAIRSPAHPLAQTLIQLVGTPLAAPSANKFGRTSPSRPEHVAQEFAGDDLLIIDGGACAVGVESTVIEVIRGTTDQETIRILRPGGVTEDMLQHALTRWSQPVSIVRASSTASPGHLTHHYMPQIPLVILREQAQDVGTSLSAETRSLIAQKLPLPPDWSACELLLNDVPALAARELYSNLHRLAASGADVIYVRATLERRQHDLWSAIWDRLQRAASVDLSQP